MLLGALGAQACLDPLVGSGRMIDPESGLDRIPNVGGSAGRVGAITADGLDSEQTVRATVLVIAPGFIALYLHGQCIENCGAQIRNGATKALELEIGVEAV